MWRIRLTIINKGYGRLQKEECRRTEQRGQGSWPVRRNDDRENRGHSKGLEKALGYGGYATVAPQPSRARVHRDECCYKIPRFCTFDCVQKLNKPGKDGEELPRVSVLRGEKSFPVMLTTFTCIHKETKEKIKYDDYKKLSDDEKEQYNVYPKMQVFRVFNVARASVMVA